MEIIKSHEAKTHWSALLRRVASGQEVIITKRGIRVARIVPEPGLDSDPYKIAQKLKALRQKTRLGRLNWKDLRDEGRA